MAVYPFNPGMFQWGGPYAGWFRPRGPLITVGTQQVKSLQGRAWAGKDTLAARLIVGFNVGAVPTYTLDDLMRIVQVVREQQLRDPSASFVAQRGIYQHQDPSQGVVHEDGGQIFIVDLAKLDQKTFEDEMVQLAEHIARAMQQEIVIVEIQLNGITQIVHGIDPS
jgi:hypothetical protein